MRLFIAIEFPDYIKLQLAEEISLLKSYSDSGNFTVTENLHLTLVFLGEIEVSKLDLIKKAMLLACDDYKSSFVKIKGFGRFKNRGELLYWRGLECSDEIIKIQFKLANELRSKGFEIEKRKFKPHITMGRRCVMSSEFKEIEFADKMKDKDFEVKSISLMKSERIGGRMVYTSIFS